MAMDTTKALFMGACLASASLSHMAIAIPPVVFSQVNVGEGQSAGNISNFIIANDFSLNSDQTLGSMRIWISDAFKGGDNGVVDNFSGTISWAIYNDGGNGKPSSLVASGSDSAPHVVDAGFQAASNVDVARVDFSLYAALSAGTYWIALHEGEWLQPYDGTAVGWLYSRDSSLNPVGFGNPSAQDGNVTSVSRFWSTGSQPEYSFMLFSVPEPSSTALFAIGVLISNRRR